jgi:hypothetical protein
MNTSERIKIGMRFGNLVVCQQANERLYSQIAWECLCDCGKVTVAASDRLLKGRKISCGCLKGRKGIGTMLVHEFVQ